MINLRRLKKEQFLPSITTTRGSIWQDKIKEIDVLGLKKAALFPTCLDKKQRSELFSLLEKTKLKEIPLVHLRSDMDLAELEYLVKNYKTKVFNIHSPLEYPFAFDYSPYKDKIYIENTRFSYFKEVIIKQWAGICLDLSHLENYRLMDKEKFEYISDLLKKYPIGCNHISAVMPEPFTDEYDFWVYGRHHSESLSEFDYLKEYPLKYFSNLCAIELENSLKEQLRVIEYIVDMVSSK